MGPVDVVELLPDAKLLLQIDIVRVFQELIELELIGEMGTSTFPFRLGLLGLM